MVERRGFLAGCLAVLAAPLTLLAKSKSEVTIRGVPIKWVPAFSSKRKLADFFRTSDGFLNSDALDEELIRGAVAWYDYDGDGFHFHADVCRDKDNPLGRWVMYDCFIDNHPYFYTRRVPIDARQEFISLQQVHDYIKTRYMIADQEKKGPFNKLKANA